MVTWINALSKTRRNFSAKLSRVFRRNEPLDDVSLEELEEALLGADVPVQLVSKIIMDIDRSYSGLRVSKKEMLRKILLEALQSDVSFEWQRSEKPCVILIVGINGSGKTTSAAKLAHMAKNEGLNVVLGAADTFRAAGSDQLKWWAEHVDCDVVTGAMGADAAAVAYDSLESAISKRADVLVVDTAGRMHTKAPLMEELKKVKSALSKKMPDAPHETWIVLDASLGQNAVIQAKMFHETTPLTGVLISKLDGSSKGGFIFSIKKEMDVPVYFSGLGEGKDDLAPFDPVAFVDAMLEDETPAEKVVG